MGRVRGASGVFALGPKFQVSFLNVKMNVRKKMPFEGFCVFLCQETKNEELNIQVYVVVYAVYPRS